jgi:F-type H+-transporting ATPase subunit alpha
MQNMHRESEGNFHQQMTTPEKEIGIVVSFSNGCVVVTGFFEIIVNEKILFEGGVSGIVFDIAEDKIFAFVVTNTVIPVGSKVKRTKEQYTISVGHEMLGHMFDVQGHCIDGHDIEYSNPKTILVEKEVKGMVTRKAVSEPLSTGVLVIDSLIPIGKGQRQLLIGNRNTGKTYTALSAFIRQKDVENTICIYVSIGQQKAQTLRLMKFLQDNDALKNTIFIAADAFESALSRYLAPYVGSAVAEFFAHDEKKDVIVIYDDLSNHAIAYRELCLLMRRAPSREAYPGDVFYLHARLLERAGNFLEGGSITALPIAQLQQDDFSAYIPTNLVSITDGQIIFDTKLFNKGIKPAINTELSVSRVGSAAQFKTISSLSKSLRLDLAQYSELSVFSQFSAELDPHTVDQLEKGKFLVSILNQSLKVNYKTFQEYIILSVFKFFYKEAKSIENVNMFFAFAFDFFEANYDDILRDLDAGKQLSEEQDIAFKSFLDEIFNLYYTL